MSREGDPNGASRWPLRAVFFDFDDTLARTTLADRAAYRECAIRMETVYGLSKQRQDEVIAAYKRLLAERPWDDEIANVWMHRERLWAEAFGDDDKGLAMRHDVNNTFRDYRLDALNLDSSVSDGFEKLRAKNVHVVIITNGHHVVQREKLAACRIYKIVKLENILVGGEEVLAGRAEKPDASIFHEACKRVDVAPDEVMHVGDSWHADMVGAQNAGLRWRVWVSQRPDDEKCEGEQEVPSSKRATNVDAVPRVENIKEFFELLDKWLDEDGTLPASNELLSDAEP
jgi:HAD superfamily hydrolase (TIGR01549 family)